MKLLVVEDEVKIRESLKKGFESEGFVVDVASDGGEGFDLASSEKYDCIVLDLMLPVLDGVGVCKKLRAEGNKVPILMLTAKSMVTDKVHGLDSGADDYLSKPFSFLELLARVRALTRRPIESYLEDIVYSDLVISPSESLVKRAGKVIKLSKKEFLLLEFLVRNGGKTVAKDKILTSVWSYESNVLPNTLEVYIGYLRNKVDKAFPDLTPLIHTVRGFGYKLSI